MQHYNERPTVSALYQETVYTSILYMLCVIIDNRVVAVPWFISPPPPHRVLCVWLCVIIIVNTMDGLAPFAIYPAQKRIFYIIESGKVTSIDVAIANTNKKSGEQAQPANRM